MISDLEYQKYENVKKLQNTYSELTFMWQPIAKNFIKIEKNSLSKYKNFI